LVWEFSGTETVLRVPGINPLIIQPVAQSLYVGTGTFGSDLFCAGCQTLLFLLGCLVFGKFTFILSTAFDMLRELHFDML
jgi:hypothetical protein